MGPLSAEERTLAGDLGGGGPTLPYTARALCPTVLEHLYGAERILTELGVAARNSQ